MKCFNIKSIMSTIQFVLRNIYQPLHGQEDLVYNFSFVGSMAQRELMVIFLSFHFLMYNGNKVIGALN